MKIPDWSGTSGEIWARRWRDTDRALADLGAALDVAIHEAAPSTSFHALDVGCGPGTTSLALAANRPEASIVGCDLSEPLIAIARERAVGQSKIDFVVADAENAAREYGPFDLVFSRHGVMFFDDPYRSFSTLRGAAAAGGRLVFSCFQSWDRNPWAAALASAAAGYTVPSPGREPSGFAFAEPDYVHDILSKAGWMGPKARSLDFDYVAGEGPNAVEQALSFFVELGPASRVLEEMDGTMRKSAEERMREVIGRHLGEGRVIFPGAAWIWSAAAE